MRESTVDNEVATTSSENTAGPATIDEVKPEISNFTNVKGSLMIFTSIKMETLSHVTEKNRNQEDIMSVLIELEKQTTKATVPGDSSDDEAAARALLEQITPATDTIQRQVQYDSKNDTLMPFEFVWQTFLIFFAGDVELMDSDSEEDAPMVRVGDMEFPVHEVPSEQIARMTPSEKDAYVQLHQEYMERMGYLD